MQIHSIVLASRNPGKIKELREVLGDLPVKVLSLEDFPGVVEPEETGETFADNARDKAIYYARATGQWCLADDSGLEVDALGGEPGVHSARYAAERVTSGAGRTVIDAANNAKLLEKLSKVSQDKRTARFVCHLALADTAHVAIQVFDTVEGRIGYAEAGSNGFGYDPLFYIPQFNCTTAQLTSQQKNQISHRGKAVRQFARMLKAMLEQK